MKKYKNLWEYLSAEWFNMVGGLFIGLSIPVGPSLFSFPDFYLLLPLGILLLGISAYYKFYKYD